MNKTLLAARCKQFMESRKVLERYPLLSDRINAVRIFVCGIQTLAEVIDNYALVQLCDDVVSLGDLDLNTFVRDGSFPPED